MTATEKDRKVTRIKAVWIVLFLPAIGCVSSNPGECLGDSESAELCRRKRDLDLPCQDESSLLATTTGSPSHLRCPNRMHRMRVQVATSSSREEAAALVFCECTRDAEGAKQ